MSTQKRPDEDFTREIRAHIDIETSRLIEDGLPPDQARAAARRAFGNVTRAQERFYERRRLLWLDHLRQDVRCAARSIRRYPVAALVAVTSLAGGIGATTVTLMVRDVLFRKAPRLYVDPSAISRVQIGTPDRRRARNDRPASAAAVTGAARGAAARRARRVRAPGSIWDPELHVFVWPVLAVLLIGVIATLVPSRRALRINPAVLLRST